MTTFGHNFSALVAKLGSFKLEELSKYIHCKKQEQENMAVLERWPLVTVITSDYNSFGAT